MPPPLLIDLDRIDLDQVLLTQEQIYDRLPHRYEFMLLGGVCYVDIDKEEIVAFRDIRPEDWWFRGHIPGRPVVPGVLLLEMAGQLAAVLASLLGAGDEFIGFGSVTRGRFRGAVVAPSRLYLLVANADIRARRITCDAQGAVDGKLVFDAKITGIVMR